jgi:hypothetical protein
LFLFFFFFFSFLAAKHLGSVLLMIIDLVAVSLGLTKMSDISLFVVRLRRVLNGGSGCLGFDVAAGFFSVLLVYWIDGLCF